MFILQRKLSGLIGLALVGYLGYHVVYLPQQKQVAAIRKKITQANATQQMQSDVAILMQQLEQYRKRLPAEADPSWLASEVVALSEKAKLQLRTITQAVQNESDTLTRLSVNLQFLATYHQLGTFLDYIESSERFIRVDRCALTTSGSTNTGEASVDLTLSTLYIPPLTPGESQRNNSIRASVNGYDKEG